ncbi:hypothetical protein [Azospirillum canadense]|uniref:hypothetical protein n=1 Tax=Azospirillum canadense TaxID=403962 RepID=UPI0022275785|nr:hypothetical protein [Azospirillum canadense]MCW2243196.1 hypothetical protein [Azospirillum canadense]
MKNLTARLIGPLLGGLERLMLDLRLGVDRDVEVGTLVFPRRRHRFPKGYCREITDTVLERLTRRVAAPDGPVLAALAAFRADGGPIVPIWGALRERYFQNALQFGDLYVDVANDTVDVTKPKVEILPLDRSGLQTVSDIGHFARIARLYWGGEVWANTLFPRLAPILPIVHRGPDGRLSLHPDSIAVFAENLVGGGRSALDFLTGEREAGRCVPADVAASLAGWQSRGPWFSEFSATADWERLHACFSLVADPSGPYRSVQGFLEMVEAVKAAASSG